MKQKREENPNFAIVMMLFRILIVLLFLIVILGAGWLLRKREKEHEEEMETLQREIQIIRLSAEGLSAAQIAERLFLSVHTVNTHHQRIYSKMGVKNVTEMLHKADEMGLL